MRGVFRKPLHGLSPDVRHATSSRFRVASTKIPDSSPHQKEDPTMSRKKEELTTAFRAVCGHDRHICLFVGIRYTDGLFDVVMNLGTRLFVHPMLFEFLF